MTGTVTVVNDKRNSNEVHIFLFKIQWILWTVNVFRCVFGWFIFYCDSKLPLNFLGYQSIWNIHCKRNTFDALK